jgi:hypothetical protein
VKHEFVNHVRNEMKIVDVVIEAIDMTVVIDMIVVIVMIAENAVISPANAEW